MKRDEFYKGKVWLVEYAWNAAYNHPARKFLKDLDEDRAGELRALIYVYADTGSLHNPKKFKKVSGRIFEFKVWQARLFCYMPKLGPTAPRALRLLSGVADKKKDALDPNDVDKAQAIATFDESV